MRIVAGKFAGRQLTSPADKRVRPTAEHVRDAVMRALGKELDGARVLDLFAGTGALGLEAMSRGAKYADFVETRPASLHALKANIAALRVRERSRVFKKDAIPFAASLETGKYDIAFADPPYGSAMLDRVLESWQEKPFARVLVVEHQAGHPLPPGAKTHLFADTVVSIFKAKGLPKAQSSSRPKGDAKRTSPAESSSRPKGDDSRPQRRDPLPDQETKDKAKSRKRPPKSVRDAARELKRKARPAKGGAKKEAGERPRRVGQRQDRTKPSGVGKKRAKAGSKPRIRE